MRVIYRGGFVADLAVLVDPGDRFHMWLFGRHPDGQWVSLASLAPLLEEDLKVLWAANEAGGQRRVQLETENAALKARVAELEREKVSPADRAVMLHLVRCIQDSPDVRYYLGGRGTRMHELLCAAIAATGFKGEPAEALRPAEHRRDDEPRVKVLERQLAELEASLRR